MYCCVVCCLLRLLPPGHEWDEKASKFKKLTCLYIDSNHRYINKLLLFEGAANYSDHTQSSAHLSQLTRSLVSHLMLVHSWHWKLRTRYTRSEIGVEMEAQEPQHVQVSPGSRTVNAFQLLVILSRVNVKKLTRQ